MPVALVAIAAIVVGTAVLVSRPVGALIGVLLIRAAVDRNDAFFNLGAATVEGMLNAVIVASGALALVLTGARIPGRGIRLALLGSLGVCLLSLLWSIDRAEGVRTWLHLAGIATIFLLAAASIRRPATLRTLVTVTLVSSIVPIAVGLVQLATGSTYTRQGFSAIVGTFDHSNGFAFYLLLVMTLALVTLFERRGALRVLAAGVLLTGMVAFVVTYTRSAWIGWVLVLGLLAALQYRRLIVVAVVAVIVAGVMVPSGVGLVEERFADLSSESSRYSDNSLSWREENWSRMFHFATERPAQGWGLASYPDLAIVEFGRSNPRFSPKSATKPGVYAHNDYLRLAVETGVPGMLLWVAVLVGLCAAMWRARRVEEIRPYATAMFAAMVAVIFIGAVDNMQGYTGVMYYLVALCGGVIGVAAGQDADAAPG